MSNSLEKYTQIKKEVEKAQKEADQAEGALGQVMKSLKDDFACSSLVQANKTLKTLQKKEVQAKEEFEEALEEFEENWGEVL